MLHFSFVADSVSVDNETEIDVLLNWKSSLKNENQSLLPSWTLHKKNIHIYILRKKNQARQYDDA